MTKITIKKISEGTYIVEGDSKGFSAVSIMGVPLGIELYEGESVYLPSLKDRREVLQKRKYKRQFPKVCVDCGKICKGKVGVAIHRKRAHKLHATVGEMDITN